MFKYLNYSLVKAIFRGNTTIYPSYPSENFKEIDMKNQLYMVLIAMTWP